MSMDKLLEIGFKKRNGEINESWNELAKLHSNGRFQTGEAYRCWMKGQVKKGKTEPVIFQGTAREEKSEVHNYKEKIEINKDGSQSSDILIEMSKEQSKDVDFLLQAHGYDKEAWELTSARNNIWNVYSKVDGVQTLYSSKIAVKPRVKTFDVESIKEMFAELSKTYTPPVREYANYHTKGKTLEIEISDIHVGKLAAHSDAGDTYNKEIARQRFFHIINDVLERSKRYEIAKILFVYSHDFFHVDNLTKTTTGGTPQDMDGTYSDMYKFGLDMLVKGIDLMAQVAPVETILVGANHDRLTSYMSAEYLSAWFRKDQSVTIDTDFKSRKYKAFGKNLIGFAHGHNEKSRIHEVMQIEAREHWGKAQFCEFHCGHFHSERTVEKGGLIVRYLGSPAGSDAWHYNSGYVGAQKRVTSFVWDDEKGIEDILYTVVD